MEEEVNLGGLGGGSKERGGRRGFLRSFKRGHCRGRRELIRNLLNKHIGWVEERMIQVEWEGCRRSLRSRVSKNIKFIIDAYCLTRWSCCYKWLGEAYDCWRAWFSLYHLPLTIIFCGYFYWFFHGTILRNMVIFMTKFTLEWQFFIV